MSVMGLFVIPGEAKELFVLVLDLMTCEGYGMIPRLVKPKRMTLTKPDSEKRKEAKLWRKVNELLSEKSRRLCSHRSTCRDCNLAEGGPSHDCYGKDSDCVHCRIASQR